jgi:hypothetical protein
MDGKSKVGKRKRRKNCAIYLTIGAGRKDDKMSIQLSFPTARNTDPETSKLAGKNIAVKGGSQRAQILAVYLHGEYIDDEIGQITGLGNLPNCCYWKRCSELRQAGYIEPTGFTRRSRADKLQQICRITEAGRRVLDTISRT